MLFKPTTASVSSFAATAPRHILDDRPGLHAVAASGLTSPRRQTMDETALRALLISAGVLAVTLFAIVRRTGRVEPNPEPSEWGGTDAAHEWDEKAAAAREEFGLLAIRATAKTWGASIAGLLGILSTVAFVAGPDNLVEDVGGGEADVAAWLILAAAASAAIAVTLAILAEQGVPRHLAGLNGWKLRSLTEKRAKAAAGQLKVSRYLVLLALLLILLATGIAWMTALTGEEEPASQEAIVVTRERATCGTLTSEGGSLVLEIGDGEPEPVGAGAAITLVENCP